MKNQRKRNSTADGIVASADVELAETQLDAVSGGDTKKGEKPLVFLKIKLTQVLVTSY